MEMTPQEILRDYQQAKNKKEQIRILADLNQCSVQEITDTLLRAGLDYRCLPRSKKDNTYESTIEPAQPELSGETVAAEWLKKEYDFCLEAVEALAKQIAMLEADKEKNMAYASALRGVLSLKFGMEE